MRINTVDELLERLQELKDDGFGECEVRLAFQPNWPLQFTVAGIATPDDIEFDSKDDDDEVERVVYIVEGSHPHDDSPYAPRWVFEAV